MRAGITTPKSFFALLWASVNATNAHALGVLGLLVTSVSWLFRPPVSVPFSAVLGALILGVLVLVVFGHAAATAFALARQPLPSLRLVRNPPEQFPGIRALCFLDPSDLFSQDMQVSFYLVEEGQYELLFGLGHVLIIQGNGLIQVALTRVIPEHEPQLPKLLSNDAVLLRRLLVKPSLPRMDLHLASESR